MSSATPTPVEIAASTILATITKLAPMGTDASASVVLDLAKAWDILANPPKYLEASPIASFPSVWQGSPVGGLGGEDSNV